MGCLSSKSSSQNAVVSPSKDVRVHAASPISQVSTPDAITSTAASSTRSHMATEPHSWRQKRAEASDGLRVAGQGCQSEVAAPPVDILPGLLEPEFHHNASSEPELADDIFFVSHLHRELLDQSTEEQGIENADTIKEVEPGQKQKNPSHKICATDESLNELNKDSFTVQKPALPVMQTPVPHEDDDQEEDEEDIAAAAQLALAALTPRSALGVESATNPKTEGNTLERRIDDSKAVSCTKASLASSKQHEFRQHVEISMSTRLLLLRWARWGRNARRISQENQIKALQHTRYPKTRPTPQVVLSPQPTPKNTPRADKPLFSRSQQLEERLTGAARLRAGGMTTNTLRSREGAGSKERAGALFQELIEEQRESMQEQGTRLKLTQRLGAEAAKPQSNGTPGFGVETPCFASSMPASGAVSVCSSGVASPARGGQLSPWILEAEAMIAEGEEEEEDGLLNVGLSAAWGMEPTSESLLLSLEEEILGPRPRGWIGNTAQTPSSQVPKVDPHCADPCLPPLVDDDELQNVRLFEDSPKKESIFAAKHEPPTADAHPPTKMRNVRVRSLDSDCSNSALEQTPSPPCSPSYKAGQRVSYWSSSQAAWMPAKVVERKSRNVYVIDKQMRGCLSKVRASELISEDEEKKSHVFRALLLLESQYDAPAKPQAENAQPTRVVEVSRQATIRKSGTKSPVSTRASSGSHSPVARSRGQIVRDDFSDDSDG